MAKGACGARIVPLLLLAAVAAGAGCRSGPPRIEIAGQQAMISPAILGVCSIFLSIANRGDRDDALVGASVEIPGTITQVHDVREGKMVRAERVVVPAGGAVELRPGGLHIMVFELPRDVAAGSEMKLHLRFETSGEVVTSVKVRG